MASDGSERSASTEQHRRRPGPVAFDKIEQSPHRSNKGPLSESAVSFGGRTCLWRKGFWFASLAAVFLVCALYFHRKNNDNQQQEMRQLETTITRYSHQVLHEFPHHRSVHRADGETTSPPFTQGFQILRHFGSPPGEAVAGSALSQASAIVAESSGLYGESYIKIYDLRSGEVFAEHHLPAELFAEGIAIARNIMFALTWREYRMLAFKMDPYFQSPEFMTAAYETVIKGLRRAVSPTHGLRLVAEWRTGLEGWGVATDGRSQLWTTSGDDKLRRYEIPWEHLQNKDEEISYGRDVEALPLLQPSAELPLTCGGSQLWMANDLHYDARRNSIWANVFGFAGMVELDPETGACSGVADMSGLEALAAPAHGDPANDVMNGIAAHTDMEPFYFFVTGKRWPKVFKVRLSPMPDNK